MWVKGGLKSVDFVWVPVNTWLVNAGNTISRLVFQGNKGSTCIPHTMCTAPFALGVWDHFVPQVATCLSTQGKPTFYAF